MSIENNSFRKNLLLSACFCWDSRLSSREMDQKLKFGGSIGYGNSNSEFLYRHFKLFRLHARLHDAVGSVWPYSGEGSGNCYMIGRGPTTYLFGHLTGLLFCLYVRIFLPSSFISVDF